MQDIDIHICIYVYMYNIYTYLYIYIYLKMKIIGMRPTFLHKKGGTKPSVLNTVYVTFGKFAKSHKPVRESSFCLQLGYEVNH